MFFPFVLLRLDYWNIMGISDACLERTKLNEIEQLGNKSDVWDSTCLLVECRMCRPFQPPKKEASERSLWIPYASWKTAFTYPDFMSLGVVRLGPCLRHLQISTILRSVRSVVSVVPPDVPAGKMTEVDLPGLLQCRPENEAMSAEQVKPQGRPGVRCTSW